MKKSLILSLFLVFVFTSLTYAADPNLVGWWPFNTNANDYSGYSNDGTFHMGANLTIDPERNIVLQLDGSSDFIEIVDDSILDVTEFSVSVWFKVVLDDTEKLIIQKRERWKNNYYVNFWIQVNDNSDDKIYAITADGSTISTVGSDNPVIADTWYHVVQVFDGTTHMMYVNGVLQSDTDTSITSPYISGDQKTYIGRDTNGGWGGDFNGSIDNVRIYDKALSAEEIQQLFQDTTFSFNPPNQSVGIDTDVILSWFPQEDAVFHDVYLGIDFNDVNDADTLVYNPNNVYKGRQTDNSYDPCGLDINTTYFWRIDEVNDSCLWRGDVSSFTTKGPVIEISTDQFHFKADWNSDENPDDQILTITNAGYRTLNWQITEDCNWLTVTPLTGSSTGQPNDVTLSVDITDLDEGVHQCELIVSDPNADNSPRTVTIMLSPACFPSDHPDYDQWVMAGKPDCWCYPRQCHGDADGNKEGSPIGGYYYVGPGDIGVMVPGWMVREPPKGPGISAAQACGDYDHAMQGNIIGGYYRVGPGDIAIMVDTWMVKEPPKGPGIPSDCLPGNRTP